MFHGPIPLREAVAIAQQIGEALDAAHDKGIMHRDLKPANIKVTPDGTVKVLDFGLAKAFSPSATPEPVLSQALTADRTHQGVILGTSGYMSPEQARGDLADKRTDIWAFGCVLYEMLTGRRTFSGATASDTFAAVLNQEPDWNALPPSTPEPVRTLLRRCLEKDRKRRRRDIGDALVELQPAAASPVPTVDTTEIQSRSRRWGWRVAVALGVILAFILTGAMWDDFASLHRLLSQSAVNGMMCKRVEGRFA